MFTASYLHALYVTLNVKDGNVILIFISRCAFALAKPPSPSIDEIKPVDPIVYCVFDDVYSTFVSVDFVRFELFK